MHRLLHAIFILLTSVSAIFAQTSPLKTDTISTKTGGVIVRSKKDTIPKPDTLIYSWKYAHNSFVKMYAEFDTTLMAVQLPEIYKREWPGYVYLGNVGLAVQNSSFYNRSMVEVNWKIKNFYPYLRTHKKQVYYNTKAPFTQIHYVSAGSDWEYFAFRHTQNASKNINIGLAYEIFNSEGFVIFQNSRNRNFGVWADADYDKYRMHGSINFNNIDINENGGIRSNYLMFDTVLDLQNMNTKLSKAKNLYSLFNGGLDHELRVLKLSKDSTKNAAIWVSHHFNMDIMQHKYTDVTTEYEIPETGQIVNFYPYNYNGTLSNDTSAYINYTNRGSINFQIGRKTKINFGPFIMYHDVKHRNYYRDTLFTFNNDTSYTHFSVGGQFTINRKQNYSIDIQGQYYPFEGYNHDDYEFASTIVKWQPFTWDTLYTHLQVFHSNKTPDYLLKSYYSNHYKWTLILKPINEIKAELNVRLIKYRFSLTLTANNITNYIYFNKNTEVTQHNEPITVFGAELVKKFSFLKVLNLDIHALGQYTTCGFIDIPEFTAKGNFYLKKRFNFKKTRGKVDAYLGVSGWYNTNYYAPTYSPAIGQFYMQREEKIGNYPIIEAFIGARIKTFLVFLRYEHINSGMRGTSYYSAYQYPMRPRNLRFGISWNFYN